MSRPAALLFCRRGRASLSRIACALRTSRLRSLHYPAPPVLQTARPASHQHAALGDHRSSRAAPRIRCDLSIDSYSIICASPSFFARFTRSTVCPSAIESLSTVRVSCKHQATASSRVSTDARQAIRTYAALSTNLQNAALGDETLLRWRNFALRLQRFLQLQHCRLIDQ